MFCVLNTQPILVTKEMVLERGKKEDLSSFFEGKREDKKEGCSIIGLRLQTGTRSVVDFLAFKYGCVHVRLIQKKEVIRSTFIL